MEPIRNKVKRCIVLGGKMYSGKSYYARALQKLAYMDSSPTTAFEIVSCASKLKELINTYYGVSYLDAQGTQKEMLRPEYQEFGTEVVRKHYKDDFWVTIALREPYKYLIFDDVRYPIEVSTIKDHSSAVTYVWIDASDEVREARCLARTGFPLPIKSQGHSSENSLTGEEAFWDFRITNNNEGFSEKSAKIILDKFLSSVQF